MNITLPGTTELGAIVKAVRKSQNLRQDDTASSLGVSENFLSKIEQGSDTVQWGKLFDVLSGLGIKVSLNLPVVTREEEEALAEALRKCGVSMDLLGD